MKQKKIGELKFGHLEDFGCPNMSMRPKNSMIKLRLANLPI